MAAIGPRVGNMFYTGILLKVPTMSGRDFDFTKEIRGKKVS